MGNIRGIIMGTWGTAISSNDKYADIYEDIMDEFNKGVPIETVIYKVIETYEYKFKEDDDSLHNLYFAAGFAAWECGMQNDKLYKKIKEIIDTKSSFADWLNNQIVRDQLKFDIKVCLIKNGYPPQYSPEVFRKVMEQVENFEENN